MAYALNYALPESYPYNLNYDNREPEYMTIDPPTLCAHSEDIPSHRQMGKHPTTRLL